MSPVDNKPGSAGFMARWSQRKRAALVEPIDEAAPGVADAPVTEEEQDFDLSLLPNLEDLTGESDLSIFLQKGVPDALRNSAMRKVWALDPVIANYVGPVDYAWDFNDPTGVPGFGPLSADIDISAMLKQVMGESEPETAEDLAKIPVPAESVRRDERPGVAPPQQLAQAERLESSPVRDDSGEENADLSTSDLSTSDLAVLDLAVAEEAPAEPATLLPATRKRHGGASPQ